MPILKPYIFQLNRAPVLHLPLGKLFHLPLDVLSPVTDLRAHIAVPRGRDLPEWESQLRQQHVRLSRRRGVAGHERSVGDR